MISETIQFFPNPSFSIVFDLKPYEFLQNITFLNENLWKSMIPMKRHPEGVSVKNSVWAHSSDEPAFQNPKGNSADAWRLDGPVGGRTGGQVGWWASRPVRGWACGLAGGERACVCVYLCGCVRFCFCELGARVDFD